MIRNALGRFLTSNCLQTAIQVPRSIFIILLSNILFPYKMSFFCYRMPISTSEWILIDHQ